MSEFVGKVVLIAGALGTVGVGLAEQFRRNGATVRILEDEIGDPAEFDRRCAAIAAEHGRLDLVVQCHGAVPPPPPADALPAGDPPSRAVPGWLQLWRGKALSVATALRPAIMQERRWMTT